MTEETTQPPQSPNEAEEQARRCAPAGLLGGKPYSYQPDKERLRRAERMKDVLAREYREMSEEALRAHDWARVQLLHNAAELVELSSRMAWSGAA